MKNVSLVALALCAGAPLLAQAPGLTVSSAKGDSSLTVYGILDAGIAHVDKTPDFSDNFPASVNPLVVKATKGATGMFNGGISGTRLGIKGSTDVANGWKAIFTLETGFNVPSGRVSDAAMGLAQNGAGANSNAVIDPNSGKMVSADSSVSGQLFARGAWFGLSHPVYGTITVGRQQALILDAIPSYDPLGAAQLFTPVGFTGTYGGGGQTDSARVDDAIKYRVAIGDVKLGLLYKVAGVAGASSAKSTSQFSLAYESGPFGIIGAYQAYKDCFSVANGPSIGTVSLTAFDTKSTYLAARYKIGPVLITAGMQNLEWDNPSNPTLDAAVTSMFGQVVGGAVNVAPMTIAGVEADKKQHLLMAGLAWDVTPEFNVAVEYFNLKQDDYSQGTYNPATGLGTNGAANTKGDGKSKYMSLLLDYKFNKAFDMYVGYMNAKNSDSLASGFQPNPAQPAWGSTDTNSILGLGIRYKF